MADGSRQEPRVPYSGEQQVTPPTGAPDDFLQIRANPATFGAQIGQALQTAGKGVEDFAEGELAIWKTYQGIKNEADSTNADSKYQVDSGKVMDEYRNLPASEQISRSNEYVDKLVKTRDDLRNSLGNPAAQRAFDQLTLRSQGYMVRDVGTLSAQSHKTLFKQAATDSVNVSIDAASRPEVAFDDKRFSDSLANIRFQIPGIIAIDDIDIGKLGATIDPKTGEAHFPDTPEGNQASVIYKDFMRKAVGQAWTNRIETLAYDAEKGSPSLAEKTLREHQSEIPADTYAKLSHQLYPAVQQENVRGFSDNYLGNVNNDYHKSSVDPSASAFPSFSEQDAHLQVDRLFPGSQVTSEGRSIEKNREVHGKPDSMHLDTPGHPPQAIDFTPPVDEHGNRLDMNAIRYKLRQEGYPVTELLPEKGDKPSSIADADHIHWGWGQKGTSQAQSQTTALGHPDQTAPAFQNKEQYLLQHRSDIIDGAVTQAQKENPNWGSTQLDMVRTRVTGQIDQQITQQQGMDKADRAVVTNWAVTGNQASLDNISKAPKETQDAYERLLANDSYFVLNFNNKLIATNAKGQSQYYGTNYYNILNGVMSGKITDVSQLPDVGYGKNAPLTNTGLKSILQTIKDSQSPEGRAYNLAEIEFFKKARGLVTGTGSIPGVRTQELDEKFNKWIQYALPKIAAGKGQGKSPDDLFDEKSPDFIGWPKATSPMDLNKEVMNHNFNKLKEPPKPFDIKSINSPNSLMQAARGGHVTREQFRAIAKTHKWFTQNQPATEGPNALND